MESSNGSLSPDERVIKVTLVMLKSHVRVCLCLNVVMLLWAVQRPVAAQVELLNFPTHTSVDLLSRAVGTF